MYLRYSSSVVAPIVRSSPRASCGFSMFAASDRAFRRARADDRVQFVDEQNDLALRSVTSFRNAFSRSSNSPRYFAPAIIEPISIATSRLFFSDSGTSPLK